MGAITATVTTQAIPTLATTGGSDEISENTHLNTPLVLVIILIATLPS